MDTAFVVGSVVFCRGVFSAIGEGCMWKGCVASGFDEGRWEFRVPGKSK